MDLQYFQKELVSNAFHVNGAQVPFELLDGNRGVIALDPAKDSAIIAALNAAAAKRKCGIVKISAEDYAKKKASHPFRASAPRSQPERLRVVPSSMRPSSFNPVAKVADRQKQAIAPAPPAASAQAPAAPPPGPADGEAQVALNEPTKFRPLTRRISRRDAVEGE